jgi:protocatechuate 3,4-dioxygenase beta subunit
MRRSILFVGLFVVAAIGLVLLWRSLDSPTAPVVATTAGAEPEQTSEESRASSLAGEDLPLEMADTATDARALAAANDVDTKRTENFALDGARWIEGRVLFPLGTPSDEVLEVWALSSPVQPPAGQRQMNSLDAHSLVRAAQANETKNDWAMRSVAADGSFRVPFPSAKPAVVALIGRYLYLPEMSSDMPKVASDAAPTSLVLEPVLGGWLVVRCVPPAAREAELTGAPAAISGFKLDSRSMRRGRGFLNRETSVGSDFSFEARALPTDLRLSIVISPKTLAVANHTDFQVEPGRKTEITVTVEPGALVRGRVRDEQGAPVAGVTVESEERRFNMAANFGNSQRSTTSAADGSFELPGLRAGKTHLSATLEGYVPGQSGELDLAAGGTIDGVEIELSRGNQLKGRVTWPDATPARGATVSARGAAEPAARGPRRMRPRRPAWDQTRSTTADDDGAFTLSGLGDGPFDVQAGLRKSGSAPDPLLANDESHASHTKKEPLWTATLLDVAAGSDGLVFVLGEPKGLKGRVVDDADAPVQEFAVTASPSFGDDAPIVDRSAQSHPFEEPSGAFLLEGLQDGRYSVSVAAEGYVQTGEKPTVVIPHMDADFLVRVVRTGSASGRVVDPTGRPVSGASVGAGTPGTTEPFNFGRDDISSDSDENGDFVLEAVPSGTIELSASADGWAKSEPVTVQIAPGQRSSDLVIALRKGGHLTGEIYNSTGAPSAGRAIQLFSMDAGDMRSVTADAAGRFEADHLTPGAYQLIAQPGQKEMEEIERRAGVEDANPAEFMSQMKMASATIKDGETTHVVMGAPPKAPVKLSGTITRAGEPAPNRNVMAISEGGAMLDSFKVGKVDSSGHYEITLDKPGAVMLVVSENAEPGRGIEFYETVPEVAEHRIDLALPLGGIRGRVRGNDRRPLAGVNVQLLSDSSASSLSMMSGGPSTTATDEDGRFEFTDLHPGTFAVAAGGSAGRRFFSEDSAHGRSVRGGLRVEADKMLEGIELELSTPGRITGRVLDANGAPSGGATVYVRDAQGELLHRFSACTSDSSGRFTYEGVAPGKYTLCARTTTLAAPESKPISVRENESSEVDVTLEPGTWLRISTEDGDKKIIRAQVSVKNEREQEMSQMFAFDSIQSMMSEGISSTERRVGPLPSGKYVVTATAQGGKTTKKSITLKGQDERKVVLRLD